MSVTPLPRTPAEILAAGWEDGADDMATPQIRQRWAAAGLPSQLAALARKQQGEPLDAA
jgi:hypothetical protein